MKAELAAVTAFYGDKKAERSGVPLINHIYEGCVVLDSIHAWHHSYAGYCLHPLVQDDAVLVSNLKHMNGWGVNARNMALAMEYRAVANAWLSDKIDARLNVPAPPKLSAVHCVNDMLIADKVQNRKDFETYHKGTHARSKELDLYFKVWLETLGVSEDRYQELCANIDEFKASGMDIEGWLNPMFRKMES